MSYTNRERARLATEARCEKELWGPWVNGTIAFFVGVAVFVAVLGYYNSAYYQANQEAKWNRVLKYREHCDLAFSKVVPAGTKYTVERKAYWGVYSYETKPGLRKIVWCDDQACTETMPVELMPKPEADVVVLPMSF